MPKQLVHADAEAGTQTWHHYDEVNDLTIVEDVQDCAPILETNRRIQNIGQGGAKGLNEYSKNGIKNNMWHVATIPNAIIHKWQKEYGINVFNKHQNKEVLKLLEKPEWAYLRTGTGKLV